MSGTNGRAPELELPLFIRDPRFDASEYFNASAPRREPMWDSVLPHGLGYLQWKAEQRASARKARRRRWAGRAFDVVNYCAGAYLVWANLAVGTLLGFALATALAWGYAHKATTAWRQRVHGELA